MNKALSTFALLASVVMFCGSCRPAGKGNPPDAEQDTVVIDTTYTGLFDRTGEGFTGGDGTYSVELPDGRTLWIFGDTFIGGVNSDGTRQHQDPKFIRNSTVVMKGDSLTTLYRKLNGLNASFVIHPDVVQGKDQLTEDSIWFWPGDGYVEGDRLKLFLSEFAQKDTGMWGFRWLGTWMASFSLPSLEQEKLEMIQTVEETEVHFGHAVLKEEGMVYAYGLGNGKIHVARYPAGREEDPWEYYDGSGWSGNIARAAPMAPFSGSEQFSVFSYRNQFVLVTQTGGFSNEIVSYLSETPYGPWNSQRLLYTIPHPRPGMQLITYNALAHPDLMEDGRLLISYNVNSLILEDHYNHAWIYRPRFIRVPMWKILETDPHH